MKFHQRKFFTSTEFTFLPEKLSYTFKTLAGSKQEWIDYTEIPVDSKRVQERRSSYLYVGLVLFGVGAILGAYIYETERRLSGFNYAIWGVVLLAAFFVERKKFIVFTVASAPLILLDDDAAPEILTAILDHRRDRFIQLLRRPDFAADDNKRQGLIGWLRDNKVLTEEQLSAFESDVASSARAHLH